MREGMFGRQDASLDTFVLHLIGPTGNPQSFEKYANHHTLLKFCFSKVLVSPIAMKYKEFLFQ
jgi:hypothetical protein